MLTFMSNAPKAEQADSVISKTTKISTSRMPTRYGEFAITVYEDEKGREHVVMRMHDETAEKPPLIRLHSECLTGDVFGSNRCDCGEQLDMALKRIAQEGNGLLLYLRQEGRGIGLGNKIKAYKLQDGGMDTVEANLHLGFPADARDFSIAADMLAQENVKQVRLMTNNPRKMKVLKECGVDVVERCPVIAPEQAERVGYLATKAEKMGHLF